ncbi:MAG TPA: hypothetical protein PKG90_14410 [Chitinophagaceae bacterium]|nr:hypothetical protein [Chitinophagaceae bacterium]HNU13360.1 hypothetical protein [Chitinophagaceae bacterium]
MAKAVKKKPVTKRKTWQEKLHIDKKAEVKKNDYDFADIPAGSKMLIATPLIVDEYIRQIPKGHFTDIKQIRKDLAAEYKAQYTCPVTTGIFIRIVAEAAYEEYEKGKPLSKITPFWRALSAKSPSAKKLSFGLKFLLDQQKKEGIVS